MVEKFFLFNIADQEFLVKSDYVFEIVKDQKIFNIPFVPESVYGIIDVRGTPFTVIKSDLYLFKPTIDFTGHHILLFSIGNDNFGIFVSDVIDIFTAADSDIKFNETMEDDILENLNSEFISSIAEYNSRKIPVLNPLAIEIKLRKDLAEN